MKEVEGKRILDVGVGTGYSSKDFERGVGIDISCEMLRRAKDYKGSLILADAISPPFKDESFDTVISAGSLYYFPEPTAALKVFRKLLAPKGVLLTLTPSCKILSPFVYVFDKNDLVHRFETSGFKVEKIEKMSIAYFCKGRKS
jgi:demethylmenaquinone methyltransferase/2-methoxy-6-polyprenyl-1,4-benzoquinol methylase